MTARQAPPPPGAALDAGESAALDAVLAVILPSTSGPGAAEAAAGRYVRRRLAGPDRDWLDPLRRWLAGVAASTPGAAVAELAAAEQAGGDRSRLFEQLRLWAWSGYLCDPALGGNAGEVGWARFGWTPPDRAAGGVPAGESA